MNLVEALDADGNVTCVVGAGGKKSTLYALAGRLERAIVTATVRIPPLDDHVAAVHVTEAPLSVAEATREWPIGLVRARERSDRYRGYETETVDALAADVDDDVSVLVKADGARTRWFKAPGENEPQIPDSADVVVPIASARIVGKPLTDEHVHRPERVAELTGLEHGDRISATDVATVLASDRGGWAGVPADATVVPLINMVDDADTERTAREIAAQLHEQRPVPRVVLTSLLEDQPVVDVV